MSYDATAITVRHLSKKYRIFESPGQSFLHHVFQTKHGSDFLVLDDISFDVMKGESFGIIGKNGSGKSTMLQILAGIIQPSEGEFLIDGKISALLELGSGFDPESTGYENIYMNAAILGVDKATMDQKVQEVIDFADIGEFISQPVKTYSSGMFIRLAFAVAINVDADIILIDEALAVGDVFFRQKCYQKLNQIKQDGKTILLVSHSMNEVEQFCDRSLLLNGGKILQMGDSRDVVKQYYLLDVHSEAMQTAFPKDEPLPEKKDTQGSFHKKLGDWLIRDDVYYDISQSVQIGDKKNRILKIGLFDETGAARRVFHQGETAYFFAAVEYTEELEIPLAGFVLYNSKNTIVHGKDNLQVYDDYPERIPAGSEVDFVYKVRLDLGIDDYTFDFGTASIRAHDFRVRGHRNQEEVNAQLERTATISNVGSFSIHAAKEGNPMRLQFHGIAGLQGNIAYEVLVR